jgi:hypothetical protein
LRTWLRHAALAFALSLTCAARRSFASRPPSAFSCFALLATLRFAALVDYASRFALAMSTSLKMYCFAQWEKIRDHRKPQDARIEARSM